MFIVTLVLAIGVILTEFRELLKAYNELRDEYREFVEAYLKESKGHPDQKTKSNLTLAKGIRGLHYEATGQMVGDEEIINYYKNLQDKLTEAMCYAEDCDWAMAKWYAWAETQGIDVSNILKGVK